MRDCGTMFAGVVTGDIHSLIEVGSIKYYKHTLFVRTILY